MRLFFTGVQPNNRLSRYGLAAADKGCLCGNCIDACPVVREKERFQWQQNKRTSMALEAIVGDDCRRCYRCVRSCPQVSKDTKEYVFGFRRTEKFIHVLLAGSIFTLMATGIFLYHYRADIPTFDAGLLGWLHTLAGVLLMLVPILYWKMANGQFRRLLKNSWQWNREADKAWWEEFKAFLRHPCGQGPAPLARIQPLSQVLGMLPLRGHTAAGRHGHHQLLLTDHARRRRMGGILRHPFPGRSLHRPAHHHPSLLQVTALPDQNNGRHVQELEENRHIPLPVHIRSEEVVVAPSAWGCPAETTRGAA